MLETPMRKLSNRKCYKWSLADVHTHRAQHWMTGFAEWGTLDYLTIEVIALLNS